MPRPMASDMSVRPYSHAASCNPCMPQTPCVAEPRVTAKGDHACLGPPCMPQMVMPHATDPCMPQIPMRDAMHNQM